MNICSVCLIKKDLNEFAFRKDCNNYNRRCKKCISVSNKKAKDANPEKTKERTKKYYDKNKDRLLREHKIWRASPEGKLYEQRRVRDPKQQLEYHRLYTKRDYVVVKAREQGAKTRSERIKRIPKWLTREHKKEIRKVYEDCLKLEKETGIKHHVDHIIPLQGKIVCGLHVPWNLQILTAEENLKKNNKLIGEYLIC